MADKKYLVVFKGMETVVPKSLRKFVKTTIADDLSAFDLELDFAGSKAGRDLVVTFTADSPGWAFGESDRSTLNGAALPGSSTIYVGAMKAIRLQTSGANCEPAFLETEGSLGSMIANVTVHEIGHMLGMQDGGYDDGGHTEDPDNHMWDPGSLPGGSTLASPVIEYTVKQGDTLSGIVHRYINSTLDKCRIGSSFLTYMMVWQHPANKAPGFVAHPTKSGILGRRANDPNWIYPGEKVALPNTNLRTQGYRATFPGFLGKKSFTSEQTEKMKRFVSDRLAVGKG
jgi:predicted Zn-dependent protease with MMP-like domain